MTHASGPRPRCRPLDERAVEHAALASPVRLHLLDLLLASRAPQHIDDLAAELELHPNTVRDHLGLLMDAGFVATITAHEHRPGRPRVLYRPTSKARVGTAGCLGYRTLAHVLSRFLEREARDPTRTGERAGREWAAHLTRHEPTRHGSRAEALDRAKDILESVGFDTTIHVDEEPPSIVQHTCAFAGVVDDHASLVCAIHRGLLQGVLDGVGAGLEATDLSTVVPGRECVARLQRSDDPWR